MDKQASIDFAVKAVEDIISFFEVKPQVQAVVEDDVINIQVGSSQLNSLLIGRGAETLRSLQTLVAAMLHSHDAELVRLNIDIADYKKQRADKLAAEAEGWIADVVAHGEPYTARLNAADRRIVHRVAQSRSEVTTHSEGEGKNRVLIISRVN